MEYAKLAELCIALENTPSKSEKSSLIAEFLSRVPENELEIVMPLLTGKVFPEWSELELGLLYDAIAFVTGVNKEHLKEAIAREGDIGSASEKLFQTKLQTALVTRPLTLEKVYENFKKIAQASGHGAQDKKIKLLSELFGSASPSEAKYLVRTVLNELRVGVAEGLVRDAIAKAYGVAPELVERAYMLTNDFSRVATAAKKGEAGLQSVAMQLGVPVKPMLAQLAPSLSEVLNTHGKAALETKYDGARVQVHKSGEEVKIFSRRLENVTHALSDVVDAIRRGVTADNAILEGEAVAIDAATKKPRPFQDMLRRFRRKYEIEKMSKEIPFETYLFDVLYINGKSMIDVIFEERRKKLEAIVADNLIAEQLVTGEIKEAEKFYQRALQIGHEGIMIKNLNAPYVPGARVGYMYKLKPVMETLDLVIIGALLGTGKRAGWLGSYLLGAQSDGEFLPIGRVATGVTEEQLEELTALLKPLIEQESAGEVKLKPEVVVEIAFQEIQKSPKYASGYALRFPRIIRIRHDKSSNEADSIDRVRELYEMQKR